MTGSHFQLSAVHGPTAMSLVSSESLKPYSLDIIAYFWICYPLDARMPAWTFTAFGLSSSFISDLKALLFLSFVLF